MNMNTKRPSVKSKPIDQEVIELQTDKVRNGKLLITRRHLIYGAVGIGAVVAGGAAVKFIGDQVSKGGGSFKVLEVQNNAVTTADQLEEAPANSYLDVKHEIKLPYGTLAWANNSNLITCLIPTTKPKPLATVNIIDMSTRDNYTILKNAESQKEGFDIYDARANDKGIIWTEVNILQGEWRIYCSKFKDDYKTDAKLIDKGSSDWETPSLGISENNIYWQVIPKKPKLNSFVRQVDLNSIKAPTYTQDINSNSDIDAFAKSNGKMGTPIYSCNDGIVITPRADSNQVFYNMTYIDNNKKTQDTAALPQNIKPLHAGYGQTGFNFALDAIYTYAQGLSKLGTYTPMSKNGNKWLCFSRTPTAAPCWCNNLFVVRSTMSICALNFDKESYCILERPNASDDYGDYLASTGNCSNIVTYANVHDTPVTGEEQKYCILRIWEASR